ncbi:dynamin family protein [Ruegeria sp. HKCCD8929]|uniref:dynamin family protein n=1 Tax=Ruegeria sp. HKCCD8929 TaxID=2683006 RepID=UPI0014876AE9|nr:dynamin family protein [Ruegeria sp. HKCCD8929]
MSVTSDVADPAKLLEFGTRHLAQQRAAFEQTLVALAQLRSNVKGPLSRQVDVLQSQLKDYSARVSLVGQVKAGKTTLANALAGSPGLLPSDVNPWTSVVTTLHLNKEPPSGARAHFQFFDRDEWDALVAGGGRLGELAGRAGAQDEVDEIRQQIEDMQAKSKNRLGRNFEMLLGQKHRYDYFDHALLERYVCLGEDDTPGDGENKQGRFADLTKSAEVFMDLPQYSVPVTLYDTPGVNDPFLVREQITIHNIRNAEICVVVLSAPQALTTMDMALVRIIGNLDDRQVVLFVNRIDELAAPAEQISEIRTSITRTLEAQGVPSGCEVIFGSAKWAEAALTNTLDDLPEDSKQSLIDWASHVEQVDAEDSQAHVWELSGLPELMRVIAERAASGDGRRLLDEVRNQATNIANQARATSAAAGMHLAQDAKIAVDGQHIKDRITEVAARYDAQLTSLTEAIHQDFHDRSSRAEAGFVDLTIKSLLKQLNSYGETGTWSCEPNSLRMKLRAAYARFGRNVKADVGALFAGAAVSVADIYQEAIRNTLTGFRIEPPAPPGIRPPVILARTIALDLHSSWWRRWWQARRGYEAYVDEYRRLIADEVHTITSELDETQVATALDEARNGLRTFFDDHTATLFRIADLGEISAETLKTTFGDQELQTAQTNLGHVLETLERLAA